uniref:Ig-like domain-containing protein n=1 Tax=Salmo trutta TaxID=8032 RepID=A0A674B5M8_SALTR
MIVIKLNQYPLLLSVSLSLSLSVFLSLSLSTGQSLSSKVHQTPTAILKGSKDNVQLTCNHTIQNYIIILWYQQSTGDTAMNLIGYAQYKSITMEKSFEKHFNVSGDGSKEAYLHLLSVRAPEDSAVYYCASMLFDVKTVHCANYEAHFGSGTKLTVLDIPVTPPKVKVLPPSAKECEDRNKKKKKTLVCVATDFYPDHVTVFWQLNGGANITDGVGTDNTALRDGNRRYSITSRLRVPAKKWNKASNRFTCTVRFFNGNDDIYVADHINGEEGTVTL